MERDGSLRVMETLALAFPGAHEGIVRTIPLRAPAYGGGHELRIDDVHVLDGAHRPLRAEVARAAGALRVTAWIPGTADAATTVHLLYRVRRGLLALPDRDELYWNATGDQWEAVIGHAEAVVTFPEDMAPLAARAWTGPAGSRGEDYGKQPDRAGIRFWTTRPLRPREGLTVLVAWPRGGIRRSPAWLSLAEDGWPLALPVVTLLLGGLVWRARGRDPVLNRSVKPEYGPPPGLTPAEAGTLIDERADPREVVATLVDLAVRGYLEIEPLPGSRDDFAVRRVKPLHDDPGIGPLERTILERIFGENLSLRERTLSELHRDGRYVFGPIRDAIYRSMVAARLFSSSPFWVRQAWLAAGGAILVGAAAAFIESDRLGPLAWSLPLGLGASGIAVALLGRAMPRRTFRGARLLLHLRGFQEFLERAEKDRLGRLPDDALHRWLPWAIALNVSERWIRSFEGRVIAGPAWYAADEVTVDRFASDLERFARLGVEALLTADGAAQALAAAVAAAGGAGRAGSGVGGGGGAAF